MPDKKNKKQAEVKIDKTGAVINENGMSLASRWKSGILWWSPPFAPMTRWPPRGVLPI